MVLLVVAGCSLTQESGPDKNSLPPLEELQDDRQEPTNTPDTLQTAIYEEAWENGLKIEVYSDGQLVFSGANIEENIKESSGLSTYLKDIQKYLLQNLM